MCVQISYQRLNPLSPARSTVPKPQSFETFFQSATAFAPHAAPDCRRCSCRRPGAGASRPYTAHSVSCRPPAPSTTRPRTAQLVQRHPPSPASCSPSPAQPWCHPPCAGVLASRLLLSSPSLAQPQR
jgi:hypothetical protein